MALNVANPAGAAIPIGDRWLTLREVDFDNSYPTGGEPLTWKQLGFIVAPDFVTAFDKLGFSFEYQKATQLLVARCPGVVTTAAGAGTLDDFPLSGVGATTASIGLTAGNATTRFGGAVEVANTTDLSTLTAVLVMSIGKFLA